jgi:Chaperone of endosialidase/YadA head domain repeat (2 copies)
MIMKSSRIVKKSTVCFLFAALLFFSVSITAQNIAITDDNLYEADPSSMLDVKSTTKGLLIPRLTTTARENISPAAQGLLVFDITEAAFYYYDGSEWVNLSTGQLWSLSSNYVLLSDTTARVGIGTFTPNSKLEVKADASFTDSDTLFAVKDKDGNIVFAVFPDGAKVYVNENAKGSVGGFAVSGRSPTKATEEDFLKVTPDSTRIWIREDAAKGRVGGFAVSGRSPTKGTVNEYFISTADSTRIWIREDAAKGRVGGFAVSGRSPTKGITNDYFVSTADSTRIYVNDSVSTKGRVGGFAVSGRSPTKGSSGNYMEVTRDSTRIYVTETAKGGVGGFAVSGRSPTKSMPTDYFNISGNTTAVNINNESRVMWYPQKAALLAGEIHVGSEDSVGTNSVAIGYHAISMGEYSQAMGYNPQALGDKSSAIGNYALASAESSFAMGDSAIARGIGSYAFGSTGIDTTSGTPTSVQTIANGDYSFAFGFGSYADKVGSYAIGVNSEANGEYSFAIGAGNQSNNNGSYTIGSLCLAEGLTSFAIGYQDTASAGNAFAIGMNNHASKISSFAIGFANRADSIGAFAIGNGNIASGESSLAMGTLTKASAGYSTTFGISTIASGKFSTAFGNTTTASGGSSTAMGWNTVAGGLRSLAGGVGTTASGDNSVAFGNATVASGGSAAAFGYLSEATSMRAFTAGFSNIASGEASVALGNNTEASNYFATSTGASTVASGHTSTAMGNTITVSGDNSFGIGIDASPYTVSQSNTMAIMGGKVGINTAAPDYDLDIAGYLNIGKGIIGSGKIVFRVDGDEALWYNGTVFSWGAGAGDGSGYNYFQDNVCIGISNDDVALQVKQNVTNAAIRIADIGSSNWWDIGMAGTDNLMFSFNGVYRAQITDFSGAYLSSSDKRLKKNIEEIGFVLDKVIKLEPSKFHFNEMSDIEPKSIGFIAQDVELIFPELVNEFENADGIKYKGLTYDNFAVLSIQAIIDLNNKLESKVKTQDDEINNLKVKLQQQEKTSEDLLKRLNLIEEKLNKN